MRNKKRRRRKGQRGRAKSAIPRGGWRSRIDTLG